MIAGLLTPTSISVYIFFYLMPYSLFIFVEAIELGQCKQDVDSSGLSWDAVCFVFLLFQLRIYKSHYFRHVVTELQVQNKLAAR